MAAVSSATCSGVVPGLNSTIATCRITAAQPPSRISPDLRIRLAPPGQAGSLDLAVRSRLLVATQAEKGLEGGHRRPPAIPAEDELIEVDLQMLAGDAAVGAPEPGLQMAEGSMGTGQQLAGVAAGKQMGSLALGPVVVAESCQAPVAPPAVRVHDRARADVGPHEATQIGT